jgi:hypothetical protein
MLQKTGETGKAISDVRKYLDLYPGNKKALSFAEKLNLHQAIISKPWSIFPRT